MEEPQRPTGRARQTEQAKEQAKEKAQEGAQQAKRSVRDQVDQRSTQAGERVGSTAQDIRSVSEELRKQGKDQPAKLAEQAASRAESLGDYLQRSDGDTILRDLEDFGRQRPWAVIAGGLALGFAASRFLKASSSRRYESSYDRRGTSRPARRRAAPGMAPRDAYVPAPARSTRRRRVRTTAGPASTPTIRRAGALSMATQDPVDARERGFGELVKDLASQTSTLVRQELQLAQAEVTEKGKLAGRGAGMLAGAAVAALLGLGALTTVLIVALDGALALWLAALIVTVLWLAVAGVLAMAGKKALQASTPPAPQTVETVKEDIQWAKTRTGSAPR